MGIRRASVLASALVLLGMLGVASSALATPTSVRIEAHAFNVMPRTNVAEPTGGGTYSDTGGDVYSVDQATGFGATALATRSAAVTWDFQPSGLGPFVTGFANQQSDPTTYANWWAFVVNGYSSPLGAAGLPSVKNDAYVWFQNPDATFSLPSTLLVVGGKSRRALLAGQALTVKVLADDLAKVNSSADADRFGVAEGDIQTPAQFSAVEGATVYVGNVAHAASTSAVSGRSRTASVAARRLVGSSVTVSGLAKGTYHVWAEKGMDAGGVYVRSERMLLNVGDRPAIDDVRATPAAYTRNRPLSVRYSLNKASRVRWTVRSETGRMLASGVRASAGGATGFTWRGQTTRQLGRTIRVSLQATDAWGRASAVERLAIAVRP